MMRRPDTDRQGPRQNGGLIVLTGASHTGKSRVAEAIRSLLPGPLAMLGVDRTLEHTLLSPGGDPWKEIPLAYLLIRAQLGILLSRRWFVVLESTFTYVSPTAAAEFHRSELDEVLREAERFEVPMIVVQLAASEPVLLRRGLDTGRLDLEIIRATKSLHDVADLPPGTIRIDQQGERPEVLAGRILDRFEQVANPRRQGPPSSAP
jgi:hypothetical protein